MQEVRLTGGRPHRVLAGHPWVYRTEVTGIPGDLEPGAIVDVLDDRGRFVGRGYANPASQIFVRILTRLKDEKVDRAFFRRLLETAVAYREMFVHDTTAYRLVNAEADFLPGLIVDRYGDYLVVQTLALGIARRQDLLADLLEELLRPKGIYERNDVSVRGLEGLEQVKGLLRGTLEKPVVVEENGIKLVIDIEDGQKTGFFLDQRENRLAVRSLVKGARVLDCFCYAGGFAVNAAVAGAREVVCVDVSAGALALAREHGRINNVEERMAFREGNGFDVLRDLAAEGERFDVVILDPPSFTKSKSAVEGALRGYKEINLRGLKLIPPGGFLVTCSCSYHVTEDLFTAVVAEAARDAGRQLRLVEFRRQAKDHPMLLSTPETYYLKCGIFQVW
ncbi:MAG: class I SAM-dependent rRNA methyltransferase [Bacillota bacterium]|uniref:class I SAM-dependent rRNA methyltransferase n=1 Tax=Desulforudis sp. DRI-14 TaxID=3459793 RepID=UPI00348EEEE3